VTEVEVERIAPNPRQPRQWVDPEALRELADSIREHGLLQPLVVTAVGDGGYQLIAGERRWQAAKLAGLVKVPVVVKEATPREMLELSLVENIQRADLNPLEEAAAYHQLIDEFGLTQEKIAQRVGKDRVTVANTLRLLRLPDRAKASLASGEISEGHARALLQLGTEQRMIATLDVVVRKSLSVRQTEELVRRLLEAKRHPSPSKPRTDAHTKTLEDDFRRALGTKVELHRSKRGGRLVIHFFSDEELERLYELLVGE
jgi:ParB family chromosome partitioning protein